MTGFLLDLRYALRNLGARSGSALLAALTCALGIGAATAMYSVVDAVLLRPLPYPAADRMVSLYPTVEEWRTHPTLSSHWDRGSFSYPEFIDWRSQQTSFEAAAAVTWTSATMVGGREPLSLLIANATPEIFRLLAVTPAVGRVLGVEDARTRSPAILLSHDLWQRVFAADPAVVGQAVRLDDEVLTVAGVLPAEFRVAGFNGDVWRALPAETDETDRNNHNLTTIGLLRRNVDLATAQAEAAAILGRLSRIEGHEVQHGMNIVPRLADMTRNVRAPLWLLLGAAATLLLAACVNVAGMLLGIGIDRESELVVRRALGADRQRLARQLLTESLLLSTVGGAIGVLLALWMTRILVAIAPDGVPRIDQVGLDLRVLTVATVASVVVGLLFGIVPAITLSGGELSARINRARVVGTQRTRLLRSLVLGQVALAAVLLVTAGLLVRTIRALDSVEPGFRAETLVAVEIGSVWQRFMADGEIDGEGYDAYYAQITRALAQTPGVTGVAVTTLLPYSGDRASNRIDPEGYVPAPGEVVSASRHWVSGNYFEILAVPPVEGRTLSPEDDRPGAERVAVVNQRLARQIWPGESALGKRITYWDGTHTVVGVVPDLRDHSLSGDRDLRFYIPRRQRGGVGGGFLVRTATADPNLLTALRERIWSVDSQLPIQRVTPMAEMMRGSVAAQRFRARLAGAFATLAALLAAMAMFGLASRTVARRRHEFGVRLALGARPAAVLALVMRESVGTGLAGIAAGVAAALVGARILRGFIYGIEPFDPLTLAATAALLLFLGAMGTFVPSLRASRTDPMSALRSE